MLGVKKIGILSILVGLILLVITCERHKKLKAGHTPVPVMRNSATSTESTTTFAECSEATRLVLIEHCGKCHQSTLPSHKRGAVAIFDLDAMDQWHVNLNEKNLEGVDNRTKNKNTITDEEHAAIQEFLTLKREQLQ